MKAHLKCGWNCVIAVSLLLVSYSGTAADEFVGHCDVVFHGDSTLDSFTGTITNVPLEVICETNDTGALLLNTRIEIEPRELTTHSPKRDANMYQMFHADQFPRMLVVVSNAPLDAVHCESTGLNRGMGKLPIKVTICGITNDVNASTSHSTLAAQVWEFDLATALSLKSFKLKPPTMLLGTITVSDVVGVTAHVRLQKQPR